MTKSQFQYLFAPGKIGSLELQNRIVMAPMTTMFATETGGVSERLIDYYAERARGGVGLIIVEAAIIEWPRGKIVVNSLNISDDMFIPGLSRLAQIVKGYGATVALQIAHAGRQTTLRNTRGIPPASPSRLPNAGSEVAELSTEEAEEIIQKFVSGAGRAVEAGFDAVEIHGAHGYLISSFLSPLTNNRLDKFGGANRSKVATDIVENIRKRQGKEYPILFRISAEERIHGGITLKESQKIVKRLEVAGVDAIDVSVGIRETAHWEHAPLAVPPGYQAGLAEAIKKAVTLPVISVGRINNAELANILIREKKCDFVAMGRALIADPFLPKKSLRGNLKDICRCIACCNGCIGNLLARNRPIECDVNPRVGREKTFQTAPGNIGKKLVIVGAGPAGVMAAHVAAEKGNSVIIYEKEDEVGGQVRLASKLPYKDELGNYTQYLYEKLHNKNIELRLGTDASADSILQDEPDAVIIASGALPIVPNLKGVERPTVKTAWQILNGEAARLPRKIIVIGGGTVGSELSEMIVDMGKDITVIEALDEIAQDMPMHSRRFFLDRIREKKLQIVTGFKATEILENGVLAEAKNKEQKIFNGDMVIIASGSKPNRSVYEELKNSIAELYMVGDCYRPGRILDATFQGAFAALRL